MKFFYRGLLLILLVFMIVLSCKNDDDAPIEEIDLNEENKKPLGTSSRDLLSNSTYTSLTVELAYTNTYQPIDSSLVAFKNFINSRVNKSMGVNFVETVVEQQPNDPFTIDEIRTIEDNIRTQFTEGDNIAVFVFFSNGSSQNDTQTRVTLGTAYRNTSMVIFERTLQVIAEGDLDFLQNLETATLNHEFGHLLGLTNIQGDDIHTDHEDRENTKHCKIEDCLMFFDAININRSSVRQFANRGGSIPVLDPLCIEDLQAKGGK